MVKIKTTFLLFSSPSDLPQGNSARPVAVGLLNASSSGRRLTSSLGRQLFPGGHLIIRLLNLQELFLPGSFASSGLPCGLLGARHDREQKNES